MQLGRTRAGDLDFAYLEDGPADGPLALCLHGFPDSARTWRHLLPALAVAGFHAVAPYMRGYAPTAVPADGRYQTGALVADACALHEALGGDERAVIVGHDWGGVMAYGAASFAPERWRRVVSLATPPAGAIATSFFSYPQLKRSWYMFLFQHPLAAALVAADDFAFVERLWADWSPGFDASDDLPFVKECLRDGDHLAAALGYYRALLDPTRHDPSLAAEQLATQAATQQPTLYLHGRDDGCIGADLADAAATFLPARESEVVVLEGVGHFLHLERPDEVNARIVRFVAG